MTTMPEPERQAQETSTAMVSVLAALAYMDAGDADSAQTLLDLPPDQLLVGTLWTSQLLLHLLAERTGASSSALVDHIRRDLIDELAADPTALLHNRGSG